MPLTHDLKETIRARAQRDTDFRQALLREAVECIVNGDLETGKAVLRDHATGKIRPAYPSTLRTESGPVSPRRFMWTRP
jgi:hypothetical protein